MKNFFNFYILNKSEFNDLKHYKDKAEEYIAMVEDTRIEKERQELKKKYSKFVNLWYELEDEGIIVQIKDVKYKNNWDKGFCFEAYFPNGVDENFIDVEFSEIEKLKPISKDDAIRNLGLN